LFGETALHKAVKKEMMSVLQVLVEAGANPNAADAMGNTALHAAATHSRDVHVWNVLLLAKGDPNIRNTLGETALSAAQRAKNLEGIAVIKQFYPSW
jgi:hypothetical protein